MRRAIALAGVLALAALPAWAQCARSGDPPASGAVIDLDIVRCQVALDAQRLGELQSQLNAATASVAVLRADLAAAEAQKATLVEWLKAAQAEAAKDR